MPMRHYPHLVTTMGSSDSLAYVTFRIYVFIRTRRPLTRINRVADTPRSPQVIILAFTFSIPTLITDGDINLDRCPSRFHGRWDVTVATTGSQFVWGWKTTIVSFRFPLTRDTLDAGVCSSPD